MKEEHNRQMSSAISFDESANILFKSWVVAFCPPRTDSERVLSIDNQQSGLFNRNLRRIQHNPSTVTTSYILTASDSWNWIRIGVLCHESQEQEVQGRPKSPSFLRGSQKDDLEGNR